jgi:hypothetical protein
MLASFFPRRPCAPRKSIRIVCNAKSSLPYARIISDAGAKLLGCTASILVTAGEIAYRYSLLLSDANEHNLDAQCSSSTFFQRFVELAGFVRLSLSFAISALQHQFRCWAQHTLFKTGCNPLNKVEQVYSQMS